MTNTTQIRAYIESQGLKLGHVARVLGISSSAHTNNAHTMCLNPTVSFFFIIYPPNCFSSVSFLMSS